MLIAEAQVCTDRPSRYLVQLCRHLSTRGRHLGHRRRAHAAPGGAPAGPGGDHAGPVQARIEWTETTGLVELSWGRCLMTAEADRLVLRAEAEGDEGLRHIQELVGGMLTRFSRRDRLEVTWRRSEASPV